MQKYRGRLTEPLVRENGSLRPASWDEALDTAATGLARAREQDATRSFGMFSCSKTSNEVNFLAQKFARSVMGSSNIDSCVGAPGRWLFRTLRATKRRLRTLPAQGGESQQTPLLADPRSPDFRRLRRSIPRTALLAVRCA